MAELWILTCPVCEQSVSYRSWGPTDQASLKDEAWEHLDIHRLPESKQGIYGVMMVEEMDRVEVDRDEPPDGPFGEWTEETPKTLAA